MAFLAPILSLANLGFAAVDASTRPEIGASKESASLAAFLFGVVGLLLFIFFTVIVLTTVSRAIRRKRAAEANAPTDISVDAWSEAGKRLGKPTQRRGRTGS